MSPLSRIVNQATRAVVPRYDSPRRPLRQVAIVIPLSTRRTLLPEEELSLRHLERYLSAYDRYFVAARGSSIRREGYNTIHVPRKFFGSVAAHNRLLMWPQFYHAFADYEYILIYHLDALVFSDQLLQWCRAGWDYIGAPWIPSDDAPWISEPAVGNGGFTLMRVDSVLRVLYNRHCQKPESYWSDLLTRNSQRLRWLPPLLARLHGAFPKWQMVARAAQYWHRSEHPAGANNDFFWSFEAVQYLPSFKVATFEDGLRFAFEAAPRTCFGLNEQRLPFGCHAWTKYDRAFWEPFLLREAEQLPASPEKGAIAK